MKQKLFILFLFISSSITVLATDWYVSPSGNDASNGKSAETPLRTLQKAESLVQPGDVVLIANGVYVGTEKTSGSATLSITCSGRAGAWITWKAMPGNNPVIRPGGAWAAIQITGSYHILEGLTVIGNNDSIVLLKALEDAKKKPADPFYNANGIVFEGRKRAATEKPHHLVVRKCNVSKCAGGGIVGLEMDYLTIEDCKVFENSWFMRYGGSGITTLNNWAFDDAPGYHIIIQRNYVWNNKTLVPWETIGKLSDGNGILLDVTDLKRNGATNPNADAVVKTNSNQTKDTANTPAKTAENKPSRPEWKARALIANNLSAYNGGSGIHVFRTKHVDIINNTTYWNGSIVGYQELFPNASEDVVIQNNIIVPRPGGKVTSDSRNTNIRWDYNLYPAEQKVFKGAHDIVADPLFIDIQADPTRGDFRLAKGSPGLNTGGGNVAQPADINGKKRPNGKARDIGAFEQ
ncbi:MAG: right-handed parallel beta-helix repeat-containing protein [Ferruginibacter sp.]|nr:right-handed parallel beta-helix repeat-containing protein [Ferruginibacter sp.]